MISAPVKLQCSECDGTIFEFRHLQLAPSQIIIVRSRICLRCKKETVFITEEAATLLYEAIFCHDTSITRHFYKLDVEE